MKLDWMSTGSIKFSRNTAKSTEGKKVGRLYTIAIPLSDLEADWTKIRDHYIAKIGTMVNTNKKAVKAPAPKYIRGVGKRMALDGANQYPVVELFIA